MSLNLKSDVKLLAQDDGALVEPFGNRVSIKLSGEQTGGAYALLHVSLRPSQPLPPLHRHDFDEVLHVLDGALTVRTSDGTACAEAGTTVFVPRGAAHTIGTPDDAPATFVAMVTPAGFEHFFTDLAALVATSYEVDHAATAVLTQRYGVEVLEAPTT
jgi:quercetin dioxygenase-like cupin family protein